MSVYLRQIAAHASAEEARAKERAQIASAEKQAKEFQDRKHRREVVVPPPPMTPDEAVALIQVNVSLSCYSTITHISLKQIEADEEAVMEKLMGVSSTTYEYIDHNTDTKQNSIYKKPKQKSRTIFLMRELCFLSSTCTGHYSMDLLPLAKSDAACCDAGRGEGKAE